MDKLEKIEHNLDHKKAGERKKALHRIVKSVDDFDQAELLQIVLPKLDDSSKVVRQEAVKTLAQLKLTEVPDELKIIFKTTDDDKLKNLCLSTIRRIEIEAERQATGEVEWNLETFVFDVSDFLTYINTILSHEIVTIKGEVSDIKIFRESLVFFSLIDKDGVVNCWFPKSVAHQWGVELQEGIEIVVKVKPQVSPRSGRFGLRVLKMSLSGEGSLKLALEKLRLKLEQEGLFDESRKRELPFLPRGIGLITGEDSAAYSDFVKVLEDRMGGVNIDFAPVRVQGVGSIAEIIGAIKYFNLAAESDDLGRGVDLIVLTRGGGSLEDLQSFNSEEVTRAVFSSKIPIVVAVGHEKDWSLAELAADLRASTPSNAAELIIPNQQDLARTINHQINIIDEYLAGLIRQKKQAVFGRISIINNIIEHKIRHWHNLITSLTMRFDGFVANFRQKQAFLQQNIARLLSNQENYYKLKTQRFTALYQLLLSYSPKAVLKRGYSVVKVGEKIVKSAQNVKPGDILQIWPAEGRIDSEVKNVV